MAKKVLIKVIRNYKILACITSFLDKSFYISEKELNVVVNKINQKIYKAI
jgi:hypothetical protein